ncbi:MAG: hypothetical protein KA538_12420 [Azonexus sp.]|jgi:hypothetical protein|nr:hypothetical protein [Azonexus sp.]
MNSFNALQIKEPDGMAVSGFVCLDECGLDFGNVTHRVESSGVVAIGGAVNG